ncbi:MAG TPA: hypothetical protein DEA90_13855 [Opitutae bacterium]|nr:hypothetical protein [Puniceicoccaceae bacterium]HBR95240.1 hypothetical protein [Opitutae bacterium]|tara:strand:- start:20110 stop:21654 length:1545 start_codon:yes stop_codon:yes gene_type:complete
MQIWVVNPFDQLPNESDVPLRYWSLCRTLAGLGHSVIWWSSDFSHLTKSKRKPCPDTDDFSIRLIETPPYAKNISFARLKNHRQFAQGFYQEAMSGLENGQLKAPDRIVVSLPPLGVAERAFRIRDAVNGKAKDRGQRSELSQRAPITHQSSSIRHQASQAQPACQVIVDIMDAWPETFYQAIPKPLRQALGPILLEPMHRSARHAYQSADKISAVGQSYLDLAQQYLKRGRVALAPDSEASSETENRALKQPGYASHSTAKPLHLCYHGTDLERFQRSKCMEQNRSDALQPSNTRAETKEAAAKARRYAPPLKAVYLGAMGSGYDLMTLIEVAAQWKAEGKFPAEIHFAGNGPQLKKLKAESKKLGLLSAETITVSAPNTQPPKTSNVPHARIVFHGQLGREAVNELLLSSDLALVPNRPGSLVACPYKAGEYAAAGLPMLSCLGGELGALLQEWQAGSEYKEGDAASLQAAFKKYANNLYILEQQKLHVRKMAEQLFDRSVSYQKLSRFIIN